MVPQVPKLFPQEVLNSTSDFSHMDWPKKWGHRGARLFLFCHWGPKRCFYWGEPHIPKTIDDRPINMAPSKKNKVNKL
jgi:hypothetical protein